MNNEVEILSADIVVSGHVQGVYFRDFTRTHAIQLGLNGFVRNLPSGREVEVHVEGEKEKIEKLIEYLKTGSPRSRVDNVNIKLDLSYGRYNDFSILY